MISKFLITTIAIGALAACVSNPPITSGVEKATGFIGKGEWVNAYLALETSLGNSPNHSAAVSLYKSNLNLREAAMETFSERYLNNQATNRGPSIAYMFEKERLEKFRMVASSSDFERAADSFGKVFPQYPSERAEAEERKRRELLEEQNRIHAATLEREAASKRAAAERESLLSQYTESKRDAVFYCDKPTLCAKAFSLAQVFVAENSDMKIQVSTQTIVETYGPTKLESIGARVMRIPHKGSSEYISYTPVCKDTSNYCLSRMTILNKKFSTWMRQMVIN